MTIYSFDRESGKGSVPGGHWETRWINDAWAECLHQLGCKCSAPPQVCWIRNFGSRRQSSAWTDPPGNFDAGYSVLGALLDEVPRVVTGESGIVLCGGNSNRWVWGSDLKEQRMAGGITHFLWGDVISAHDQKGEENGAELEQGLAWWPEALAVGSLLVTTVPWVCRTNRFCK